MERNTEGDGKRDGQADTENSQGGRERERETESGREGERGQRGGKNQRKQLRAQESWEGLQGRFDFGGEGAGHTGWSAKP